MIRSVDAETLQPCSPSSVASAGLPAGLHSRLTGDTVAELRTDAAKLAKQLGLRGAERDATGKFASRDVNAAIRAAAGRG